MGNIFQIPLSASLARRLAEAADGFRNVDQVYFIAGYAPPHRIKDFPDLATAEKFFTDNKLIDSEYAIFGPYKTLDELEKSDVEGVENITKIDLTIYFKKGDPQKIELPGQIDSIFLNLSSVEKFLFPYYTHLFGVEYAKKLRDNLLAEYKATAAGKVVSHINKTIAYKLYTPPGEELDVLE